VRLADILQSMERDIEKAKTRLANTETPITGDDRIKMQGMLEAVEHYYAALKTYAFEKAR
jgi:hypothetical protein